MRLAVAALVGWAGAFSAVGQPAYRAEQFVESLGLAAAPFDRYLDSGAFAGAGTKFKPETFFDLGIRYYRMGLRNDLVAEDQPERVAEWWTRTGARPLLLVDPRKSGTIGIDGGADGDFSDLVADLRRYPPGSLAGVEGPNEVNNKFPPQDLNLDYRGLTDEAAGALYQRDLWAALRADPATRDLPIIAFTAIFTDYRLAHPCDAFDFANVHSYQGADVPSSSLLMNVTRFNRILPVGATIRPFQPTEAGYNVEEDVSNGQGYAGSRRAQALNIPMLFAEYFRHGIPRTYLFALHNADGYGLLESDQTTKRPSWYAVQSLVRLLADAQWDSAAHAWKGGRDFYLRALRFEIEGAPETVHSLTLQKEDGDWYLLLWNELPNLRVGRDAENPPAPATLRFAAGTPVECLGLFAQGAITDDATSGAFQQVTPVPSMDGSALRVAVPSRVLVLRLRPTVSVLTKRPPVAPSRVDGSATENTVTVRAEFPAEPDVAEVLFFRNDHFVASLPPARQVEFIDDSAWIQPGLGYRYAIRTVAADGRLSPPVERIIITPDQRPDLVVGRFGPIGTPGSPIRVGDQVEFDGEVRNVGDGATPHPSELGAGLYNGSIGITFRVDDQVVSWGGKSGPFEAGESRVFVGTGGPAAAPRWTASAGTHVLRAEVDDVNRIASERIKSNNVTSRSITVGDYPGRLEIESRPSLSAVDLSSEGSLDWVHFGGWRDKGKTSRRGSVDPLIGPVEPVGEGFVSVTGGSPVPLDWRGGDGLDRAVGNHAGLWGNNVGVGFAFEVAAASEDRVLRIYVSGINGARGIFRASLSDDSSPDIVDVTWDGNRGTDWAPVPGDFSAVYTVRFHAASPGAKLRVSWGLESEPNRFVGQIRMQAATLSTP